MDRNEAQTHPDPSRPEPSPIEALQHLQQQLGELQAYATHFASAHVDKLLLSAQQVALWAALGVLALLGLGAILITALVLFLQGSAAGLGILLGSHPWLGQMIVGFAVVALLALATWIVTRSWQRQTRQKTVQKYEERQRQQEAAFGHSVAEQASAAVDTPY
ncbi:MAG: hypothetical protein AB7N91_19615 [Candidatus Tectimicrobiota bacterium]